MVGSEETVQKPQIMDDILAIVAKRENSVTIKEVFETVLNDEQKEFLRKKFADDWRDKYKSVDEYIVKQGIRNRLVQFRKNNPLDLNFLTEVEKEIEYEELKDEISELNQLNKSRGSPEYYEFKQMIDEETAICSLQ